jgi:hypothetical protein
MSIPDSTSSGDQQGSRSTRGRPRNWRPRPRLLLFVAIPVATAVALGGASVVSSWQSAVADQRSEVLASMSTKVCELAFRIEAERDTIVWYISASPGGRASQLSGHSDASAKGESDQMLQVIQLQVRYADPWVKTVAAGVAAVGSGYPRVVQLDARAVAAHLLTLPSLRRQALTTQVPALEVIAEYGDLLNLLLTLDDQVVLSSGDQQLTSTARTIGTISRYENEEAVQRAIVMYGLISHTLNSALLSLLTASMANQRAELTEFQNFATTSQAVMFSKLLDASLEDRAVSDEQDLIKNTNRLASLPIVGEEWWGAISDAINATHRFEEILANSAVDRARALRERAIISAIVIGGIILLVLLFSVFFTVFVWRSMAEPPRRLNSAKRWRQPRGDLGADVAGA